MNTYWTNCLSNGFPQQLLIEQFKLRKTLFVDNLNWSLPTFGEMEADQYDTPYASYCLTESEGRLVSSARIIPTVTDLGTNSYMIKDAYLGRLQPSLPPEMCNDYAPPSSPSIWEATRLTVCPSLPKADKRLALAATVGRMMQEAKRQSIQHYIAIGGVELSVGVRSAGYKVERLTPFFKAGSGRVAIYRLHAFHL